MSVGKNVANDQSAPDLPVSPQLQASFSTTSEDLAYVNISKKQSAKYTRIDEDEPLIDTTAALTLHSKKTSRQTRRQTAKERKKALRPSLNSLPSELLLQILLYLKPSDLFRLQRVSHFTRQFLTENETSIAQSVITDRYSILCRCFPTPIPLPEVPQSFHTVLFSSTRQQMLRIHRNPYQHVQPITFEEVCTCLTCILAWNNLCMIVDLAHWQNNLRNREPIPMIGRGRRPEWNDKLLTANAEVVRHAMKSRLWYAAVLEKHLATTTNAIMRSLPRRLKDTDFTRLYHLTEDDVAQETDHFLARSGPPSYEFPFHRDNYYSLEAYVPNRKWDKEEQKWRYYENWQEQHMKDLTWARDWFRRQQSNIEVASEQYAETIEKRSRMNTSSLADEEGKTQPPATSLP